VIVVEALPLGQPLHGADAASRLGISKDWLYRNATRLPFTVRVSEGLLRFSAKGIDRYIASRVGRGR